MTAPPLAFRWTGAVFQPLRPKAAQAAYEVNSLHWLEEVSDRSWASHRHFFACLNEAWLQLPEGLQDLYPSVNHLRKRALIDAGFYRETVIDAGSRAAAARVAAYVRGDDEFALVIVRGVLVIVRKARSQRMHGHDRMDKKEFQASKDAVLGVISKLIGVEPDQLRGAA